MMKKSQSNNYFRRNNIGIKNDENKTKIMKSSFENICFLYKEIHDNIISSDFQIQKIRQWYKCFFRRDKQIKKCHRKIISK